MLSSCVCYRLSAVQTRSIVVPKALCVTSQQELVRTADIHIPCHGMQWLSDAGIGCLLTMLSVLDVSRHVLIRARVVFFSQAIMVAVHTTRYFCKFLVFGEALAYKYNICNTMLHCLCSIFGRT